MSESLEREGGGHGRPVRRAPPRAGSVELRDEVRARAENRPGVYRIYGKGSELRYVGKSVQVRTRLLSYFRASEEEKAHRVIRDAEGVEWDYTPDEFSALIREMKLIQSHRPRFNVQHKRKRAYAFLKITRERAPRVLAVSRVVADGSTYFGPFPRVKALRRSVRELVHTLGIRDCAAGTLMHFSGNRQPAASAPSWATVWRRVPGDRARPATARRWRGSRSFSRDAPRSRCATSIGR